jgi:hypothetical protein
MSLKSFFAKITGKANRQNNSSSVEDYQTLKQDEPQGKKTEDKSSAFSNIIPRRNNPSLEKLKELQQDFNDMSGHIEGIENNLQNFPEFVSNQKQFNQQLLEYLKTIADKDRQILQTLQELPKKNAKENRKILWLIIAAGIIITIAFAVFQAVVLS